MHFWMDARRTCHLCDCRNEREIDSVQMDWRWMRAVFSLSLSLTLRRCCLLFCELFICSPSLLISVLTRWWMRWHQSLSTAETPTNLCSVRWFLITPRRYSLSSWICPFHRWPRWIYRRQAYTDHGTRARVNVFAFDLHSFARRAPTAKFIIIHPARHAHNAVNGPLATECALHTHDKNI